MTLLLRTLLAHGGGGAGGLDELIVLAVPAVAFLAFIVVSRLRGSPGIPEHETDGVHGGDTSEPDGG
ncbi:MAG: hypothetical protein KY462_09085 [Actinobacteria bacterium]|nr:hypothetical protein [Actinomycetota bacterium]